MDYRLVEYLFRKQKIQFIKNKTNLCKAFKTLLKVKTVVSCLVHLTLTLVIVFYFINLKKLCTQKLGNFFVSYFSNSKVKQ